MTEQPRTNHHNSPHHNHFVITINHYYDRDGVNTSTTTTAEDVEGAINAALNNMQRPRRIDD